MCFYFFYDSVMSLEKLWFKILGLVCFRWNREERNWWERSWREIPYFSRLVWKEIEERDYFKVGPIDFQFLHSTAKKDERNMLSFFVSNPTLLLSLCTIDCCTTTIHTSSSLTIFIVLFLFFLVFLQSSLVHRQCVWVLFHHFTAIASIVFYAVAFFLFWEIILCFFFF
jgi:hypothetical protein